MPEATVTPPTYYKVTAALMLLLVLTVAVSFVPLGPFGVVAALLIAVTKATVIALFFMHVRYSSNLTKMLAGTGAFMLLILFVLTFSDYVTRNGIGTQEALVP